MVSVSGLLLFNPKVEQLELQGNNNFHEIHDERAATYGWVVTLHLLFILLRCVTATTGDCVSTYG